MATDPSSLDNPARRTALAMAGRAVAGACVLSLAGGCEVAELRGGGGPLVTELDFDLAVPPFDRLAVVPSLVPVNAGNRKLMLVSLSDKEIVCLDRICTHQACDLSPDQSGLLDLEINEIVCRCHGGSFDLRGAKRSPPAPSSLKSWPVTYDPRSRKGKVTF